MAAAGAGLDDPRVHEAMEAYLKLLQAGERPDPDAFLARYADVAAALAACLQLAAWHLVNGDLLMMQLHDTESTILLSREQKQKIIERACHSLYRWYTSRSQAKRNWNPDHSFEWRRAPAEPCQRRKKSRYRGTHFPECLGRRKSLRFANTTFFFQKFFAALSKTEGRFAVTW
jgi:hypothetical protein